MAYFTFQWAHSTWQEREASYREGEPVTYVASNQFERSRVQPGDYIYVVGLEDRRPLLIGRMQAAALSEYREGWSAGDALFSRDVADQLLPGRLWEASHYILARQGTGTPMRFQRPLPQPVGEKLEFETRAGKRSRLSYDKTGRIDPQALRAVRKLAPGSPSRLDELIRTTDRPQR